MKTVLLILGISTGFITIMAFGSFGMLMLVRKFGGDELVLIIIGGAAILVAGMAIAAIPLGNLVK